MTLDERKREATNTLRRLLTEAGVVFFKDGKQYQRIAGLVSEAFAPELFTSPPTMWLAPMDSDTLEAAAYLAQRDAHLNREGK